MEKQKLFVQFVEKVSTVPKKSADTSLEKNQLYALSFDGKRLLRLQPNNQESATQNTSKKCQLIGVLTEKNLNRNIGQPPDYKRQICIDSKDDSSTTTTIALQLHLRNDENSPEKSTSGDDGDGGCSGKKIPRPANAFMLFANEWRKKLAVENPKESNKDISVRLGILWKTMSKDVKEKYFAMAREVDAEHKRKYPGSCLYEIKLILTQP